MIEEGVGLTTLMECPECEIEGAADPSSDPLKLEHFFRSLTCGQRICIIAGF
jgi:hypothetical protein